MMKPIVRLFVMLEIAVLGCCCYAENNLLVDGSFETGPVKSSIASTTCQWDNTGKKAHTGKAAIWFTKGARFYIGAPVQAGKQYRLAGFFCSQIDGAGIRLQINWSGAQNKFIKYDSCLSKTIISERIKALITQHHLQVVN